MEDSQPSWKVFTIPNLLSFIRILLIYPIIYCLLQENQLFFYSGLFLILVAIATDFFDGILARKFNQVSEIGKILDPLADKIAVVALLFVLIVYREFPLWVAVLIISRDFIILLLGLIWATKHKFVTTSNLLGKITVFCIALMIIAYVINIQLLEVIFTWIVVSLTIISGFFYLYRFIKLIRSPQS